MFNTKENVSAYSQNTTVHGVFQEQARRTPEAVALVYEGHSITYKELDDRSNCLAWYIRSEYERRAGSVIVPDTFVALCLDKGIEMIVGMLAVLKSGAAYVPLDVDYPITRIQYMLQDTEAKIILTQGDYCTRFASHDATVIDVSFHQSFYTTAFVQALPAFNESSSLAYVIYTSGTTGTPKGVMIEHYSILSLVFNPYIHTSPDDVFAFLSSPLFDATTFEVWTPLLTGSKLVLPNPVNNPVSNINDFRVFLQLNNISVLWLTKSLFESLYYSDTSVFQHLNYLITGGEALDKNVVSRLADSDARPAHFLNGYGPTESTTFTCVFDLYCPITSVHVPIGMPIGGRAVYVFDEHQLSVPAGHAGELYIGGAGLARGYLHQEELTASRFIIRKIAPEYGESVDTRLYRTGDIVRLLNDGNLEFLGRNDDQVKLRGYRIEPGEIEQALVQIPGVRQACVVAREKQTSEGLGKYLVAYYVCDSSYMDDDYGDILRSWENLYDTSVYTHEADNSIAITSDFSGWNSYVTGLAIPLPEMEAWRDNLLGKIRELKPAAVLEIGVGSGLLMYPLLDEIKRYVGLDISMPIINRHKEYLKSRADHVSFHHLRADQLDLLPDGDFFDTIILNSVCQYFPNIKYFDNVIEQAIERLLPGGHLLIGDIRNYDLHRELIREKLVFQNQEYSDADIQRICGRENELLISPYYFGTLQNRLRNVVFVVFRREGVYDNELNKFRYDVVVSKIAGKAPEVVVIKGEHYNTPSFNTATREKVLRQLSATLPEYMLPDVLIPLTALPLTRNGKLDKAALPDPDFDSSDENYVAPKSATEEIACLVWQNVLGNNRVGVQDDFFRIGGNSILAIRVSHRMSEALDYTVRVSDIFRYRTIATILANAGPSLVTITKIDVDHALLSYGQQRLWFIEQFEQGTNAYNVPLVFRLFSHTDVDAIQYALKQVVARHEVLRSTIQHSEYYRRGIQVIHDGGLTVRTVTVQSRDEYEALLKEDINRPFRLQTEYPIRATIYVVCKDSDRESFSETLLLINTHHIATDGWSQEIFLRELHAFYRAYADHGNPGLPEPLEIQYKDYAIWQNNYLTGEILDRQLRYWKSRLAGFKTLDIVTDYLRPAKLDYKGANETFELDYRTSQSLRALAKRHGVTFNSVMLSSVFVLLGKYTNQDDIVIGMPIANRHHRETGGMIGFFINMLVGRCVLTGSQSFIELMQQVHNDQVAAQTNQDLPFDQLVSALGIERDAARHPIFQFIFAVQRFGHTAVRDECNKHGILDPVDLGTSFEAEKIDLSIVLDDGQDIIRGEVGYATSLFDKRSISRLIDFYKCLLAQIALMPDKPYSSLTLLTEKEYTVIVKNWNETDEDFPDRTIPEMFQSQARRVPDNVAIICGNRRMTYRELDERSDQLAVYIRFFYRLRSGNDLSKDTCIALCLDRDVEMIIAMLAILKAGAAYVPIDPDYPQRRVDHILQDTGACVVVCKRMLSDSGLLLPPDQLVFVDAQENFVQTERLEALEFLRKSSDLAYVVYTSGTSGKSKGVMIEHGSVVNEILSMLAVANLKPSDRSLLTSNMVFDASVECVFMTLFSGGELHILKKDQILDKPFIKRYIKENGITVLNMTPGYLHSLEIAGSQSVRLIILGGEAYQVVDTHARIINSYGPTEAAISFTAGEIQGREKVHIGKPLRNTRAYVLDRYGIPVPIGVSGELYIGGKGLSRGYLGQPELTKERFVGNVFATDAERKKGYTHLYKTGDLVRWLPDGKIEFIGRNDEQIKIRGYRIEPAEIEHVLLQIKGIRQCCVVIKKRSTTLGVVQSLVVYYVLDHNVEQIAENIIRSYLHAALPEYMIPDAFVPMQALPLNINGKLDRESLPDIDFHLSLEYVAPIAEAEMITCSIWQSVLGVQQVGIVDDFFRIGGNSILAIQIAHQMSKALGAVVHVADIFRHRVIKDILLYIDSDNVAVEGDEWEI